MNQTILKVRQNLRAVEDEIRGLARTAEDENRDLRASEQRRYNELRAERAKFEARIAQLENDEERRELDAEARRTTGNGSGSGSFSRGADTVYARGNGQSYFRDLVASAVPGHPGQFEAMQRLNEHAQVIDRAGDDLPAEWRATSQRRAAGSEVRVNPNRTDGQGGYFVPPLWLVDEYVALLRAGRAIADRCNVRELPTGTDSINLPKVATGTKTGVQLDAGTVTSQDLTDEYVSAPVRTIAGQQDIAMQLYEQSPIPFDDVVFADLISDYNANLDTQVLSGSGSNGELKGILTLSGTNPVTYTSTTPTLPEMLVPITQGLSQVVKSLKKWTADSIALHPSLWYWMTSALDGQNRPIITPEAGDGRNTIAVYDANAAEGVAGAISGVPVVLDGNLPTNLGTGTNETRILSARFKQLYLWEGALRTRALVEVLSGTLQVRLQVYNYAAFMPDRYPGATSVISGTGLVMPAGY